MLYHGLIVIGTSAILLLIYNLIIVRWCARRQSSTATHNIDTNTSHHNSLQAIKRYNTNQDITTLMLPTFSYKKDLVQSSSSSGGGNDDQCAVCLSVFEDGEDLKLLPRCNHLFHKQCIDMWIYSHLDCPICRTIVQLSIPAPEQKLKLSEPSTADTVVNMV